MIVIRVATWLSVIVAILAIYRTARQRSPLLAGIFALGVTGRALLGVALFVISLFELPVFSPLQAGSGFWTLAIDAQTYFGKAATAAVVGVATINDTEPSPAYLRAFAAWMKVTGVSPANAILFNLLCYAGVVVIVLALCRSRSVAAVVIAAISIDPALVIFSTQALKDTFSFLVIAVYAAGARVWWNSFRAPAAKAMVRFSAGLLLLTLAVYVMAGIRAYVAILMSFSVLLSILGIVGTPNAKPLWRLAAANIVLTLALWGAFANGARGYYSDYRDMVRSVVSRQASYLEGLDHARMVFQKTGGGTSILQPDAEERAAVSAEREKPAVPRPSERAAVSAEGEKLGVPQPSERAAVNADGEKLVAPRPLERVGFLARGLAVLFVPISILRAWHIVSFQGGRGLLMVTDLDTVVIDVTLVACLYLSLSRRRISMMPTELCVTVLSMLMILLLAYVVTNYGTLFRIRLLAVAPLWLLPAVLDSNDEWPTH